MEQEKFKLPSSVVNQLKANLENHAEDVPKPKGFSLVQGIVALEYATYNQLAKIDSFANNYKPSDSEEKEKWVMFGRKLIAFARNTIRSEQAKKDRQNRLRRMVNHPTGTSNGSRLGGNVDRLNTINNKSTEPSKVTGKNMLNQLMTNEEVQRIKELIMY